MKKSARIIAMLFLCLAALGCGAGEKNDEKLVIGLMPDVDSVPFIVAKEKGFFAEEGVNAELIQFKSAQERDSALQSGNIDGAVSDLLAVCFAKDGGFDTAAIAATEGNYCLVAKNAANMENLAGDVAISKNTIIEYALDSILAKENMDGRGINKVIVPQIPVRLQMLQTGQIEAALLPEPMASVAVGEGATNVADAKTLGINPGVIMATKKAAAEKKAALTAMLRAYNKAADYLNNTPQDEYIDMVTEKSAFPPAARQTLNLPQYRHAELPPKEEVTSVVKWLKGKDLIKNTYDYDDIVVNVLD